MPGSLPILLSGWLCGERIALALLAAASIAGAAAAEMAYMVPVFSKTAVYRDDLIAAGIAAIRGLGEAHGFGVEATEEASRFTEDGLARYRAVIFLNTTGEVLAE